MINLRKEGAELVHGHHSVEELMFWRHKMWRPLTILHTPGLLSVQESPWQSIVLTNTSNDHCPTNLSFESKSTIVSLCLTKEIEKWSWLINSMKILTHFRMECWPLWFFPYSLTLEFSHQIPSTVKLYSFQNCISNIHAVTVIHIWKAKILLTFKNHHYKKAALWLQLQTEYPAFPQTLKKNHSLYRHF